MSIKRYLKKYYELWKKGTTDKDAQKKLKLSVRQFNTLLPAILQFVGHQIEHDTELALTEGEKPDLVKLSDSRREEFLDYAMAGLPVQKISLIMGIPLVTIVQCWLKKDPLLKFQYKSAVDKSDAEVVIALREKAIGHPSLVKTVTETEVPLEEKGKAVKDEKGKPIISKTTVTSTTTKHFAGDVNAQKFWLINRKSDDFTLDGANNRGGSKGLIMDFIDQVINGEPDKELDKEFKEG